MKASRESSRNRANTVLTMLATAGLCQRLTPVALHQGHSFPRSLCWHGKEVMLRTSLCFGEIPTASSSGLGGCIIDFNPTHSSKTWVPAKLTYQSRNQQMSSDEIHLDDCTPAGHSHATPLQHYLPEGRIKTAKCLTLQNVLCIQISSLKFSPKMHQKRPI